MISYLSSWIELLVPKDDLVKPAMEKLFLLLT